MCVSEIPSVNTHTAGEKSARATAAMGAQIIYQGGCGRTAWGEYRILRRSRRHLLPFRAVSYLIAAALHRSLSRADTSSAEIPS